MSRSRKPSVFQVGKVRDDGRTVQAGRTERTLPREWNDWFTRAAMPPLRVPDFNMSSISPAS